MKSSLVIAGVTIAALAGGGLAMRPFVPDRQEGNGGLRTFAADVAWLQANGAWERRDPARTIAMLRLTVALDPAPLYFWLNGARMLAYDLPEWQIGADNDDRERVERARRKAAEQAIEFLERGKTRHPMSAAFWIERGNIELNALHDLPAAAESYRRATEQPDAPYFAARLYAELLRRQGRKVEALAWLKNLYPKLPRDEEAAGASMVLARIHALERDLGIPRAELFRPDETPVRTKK